MSINQKRFTSGVFLFVLAVNFVIGIVVGGTFWMGFLCLCWSFIVLWVGAVLGIMYSLNNIEKEREKAKKEMAEEKQELQNQQTMIDLEMEDLILRRRNLGRDSAGLVRAITNRVANRILSKYVPDLSGDVRRGKILKDVEKILKE
jgi:hypothetical protein